LGILVGTFVGTILGAADWRSGPTISSLHQRQSLASPSGDLIAIHEDQDFDGILVATRTAVVLVPKEDNSFDAHERGVAVRAVGILVKSLSWESETDLTITIGHDGTKQMSEQFHYYPTVVVRGAGLDSARLVRVAIKVVEP
jgi:hypothetical protein